MRVISWRSDNTDKYVDAWIGKKSLQVATTSKRLLCKTIYCAVYQCCGAGVVRSGRFLRGSRVGFLKHWEPESDFFCPTPHAQLDHFYITLLNWEFQLKWYNFFWNFCWIKDFLLCTRISLILTAKFHSLYVKESEILERSESEIFETRSRKFWNVGVGYFTSDSATLLCTTFRQWNVVCSVYCV